MDIDQSYRDAMATQLSRRLAQALQNNEIPSADVSQAAELILEKIDTLTTHQEVVLFLSELSNKWPIFADYLTREKLRTTKNEDAKIAEVEASLDEQIKKEDHNGGN